MPASGTVDIPAAIIDALVEHARLEAPNESCGLILGDRPAAEGGTPSRYVATRNAAASPDRYEIDPWDLLRLTLDADDHGEVFWAIVHSHGRSPARPSATDMAEAFYPEALHVLVSLDDGETDRVTGRPSVRAWRIRAKELFEVSIELNG